MLIIPALDIKDGHCVRLKQGKMNEATVYSEDPVAMAKHWVCNDREQSRGNYSSNISERTLREIYAMPFEYSMISRFR